MDEADKSYLKKGALCSALIFGTMGVMTYSVAAHPRILPLVALSIVVGFVIAGLID